MKRVIQPVMQKQLMNFTFNMEPKYIKNFGTSLYKQQVQKEIIKTNYKFENLPQYMSPKSRQRWDQQYKEEQLNKIFEKSPKSSYFMLRQNSQPYAKDANLLSFNSIKQAMSQNNLQQVNTDQKIDSDFNFEQDPEYLNESLSNRDSDSLSL
ncbi:Hypothetical_protein [Hexamita inflata]|uniref:Hypothetical_protein n=1 Tax=Hexamita inflata TaxID=28002 RepID=A0AA86RBG2_9EUKA|nr:Hypothetical protein HINF_LOCUS62586 [Hexamita inflata]